MQYKKVYLKPGRDQAMRRFHPWVFSGAIARIEGNPEDGEAVAVIDRSGQALGIGHFHNGSISVRVLSFNAEDDLFALPFWLDKFSNALAVRQKAIPADGSTNCYRLVHGEGDGVSGLVIDVYDQVAVMQCHSIGMHRQRALIAEALMALPDMKLQGVYDKSVESLPPQYAAEQSNGYLIGVGPEGGAVVLENGVQFKVDWVTGQKTGFFLDQRDNRQLLGRYAAGKTVLNAFCYTGGFSAYALKAGAALVHSVDVSARAMELTEQNAALNLPYAGTHEGYTEDVLKFLKNGDTLYEVMVIDPPAYAKSMEKRHNAVQGYKRLNEAAIRRLAPGGILFTFSCSQVVDRELFYNTIVSAAIEAGRQARVLHIMTQGADHPVSLFHPEGSYLKGLVLFVD
ncbi:MAG: class I SAM-dependent rRNA methyltransferase [Bacteroidota bacterium]